MRDDFLRRVFTRYEDVRGPEKRAQSEALYRRLTGIQDPRGPVGIFSRGANVYNGVSNAAHKGGGVQYGRPRQVEAIARRMRRRSGAST